MTCPFCEADQPELISLFGSQLLMSQYRCRACGTYFEGLRPDALDPRGDPFGSPASQRTIAESPSSEVSRGQANAERARQRNLHTEPSELRGQPAAKGVNLEHK
jgi:hypothetical protein